MIDGLVVDMRYASRNNFVGAVIDGYDAPRCLLTSDAARALAAVQSDLRPLGLGLKVFDCYRPVRAVKHFVRWAKDVADVSRKVDYYPNIDKRDVFALGFIAARSAHSRGSTVDLTLVRRPGNAEIDMGSPFDFFGGRSATNAPGLTPEQRSHRHLLAGAMTRRGFNAYSKEWWHFTLNSEPFPHTYFDFPVR